MGGAHVLSNIAFRDSGVITFGRKHGSYALCTLHWAWDFAPFRSSLLCRLQEKIDAQLFFDGPSGGCQVYAVKDLLQKQVFVVRLSPGGFPDAFNSAMVPMPKALCCGLVFLRDDHGERQAPQAVVSTASLEETDISFGMLGGRSVGVVARSNCSNKRKLESQVTHTHTHIYIYIYNINKYIYILLWLDG